MPPGGFFGRALVVDLDDGGSAVLPLDDALLRATLGRGRARHPPDLELAPPGVEPLAPEAPLAFVFSPLVGTPLTTSAKFAVVAKSPLTDRLNDALASSHFAIAGKLTGNDAIVVRGACDAPSALIVDGDGRPSRRRRATLGPAGRRRRGAVARAARAGVSRGRDRPGGRAPGPLRDDLARRPSRRPRRARRGARGQAAEGDRRARDDARCPVADPAAVLAAAKDLRARSFGPATAKYRELGTVANLLTFNALSALPGHNFGTETTTLALEDRAAVRDSCASCSIGCERIMTHQGRPLRARRVRERVRARPAASASTIPTRSWTRARAATSSAWTRSRPAARSRGRWRRASPDWLRFGDAEALLRAIELIGAREGDRRPAGRGVAARVAARFGSRGSRDARQGARAARLRAAHAARDGARARASTRAAPTTTGRAPTRPTSSGELDRLDGGHRPRRRRDRDRGPRRGDGLADPLQVPARRVRRPVGGVGGAAGDRSPAGTSTATSCTTPPAASSPPSTRSTAARAGRATRTRCRPGSSTSRSRCPSGREAALTRERLDAMVDAYYRTRGLDISVHDA